jgi:hypothetical protein
MKDRRAGCPPEESLCGFVDGSLPEGREEIEKHLAGCEICLSICAEMIRAGDGLSGEKLETPPPELERLVLGGATADRRGESAGGFVRRFAEAVFSYRMAGAVAAVSLVALLAVWVGQRDYGPERLPSGVREGSGLSLKPALLSPQGSIAPGDSVRFRWEVHSDNPRCVLTVLNADSGTVVVREPARSGEHAVPTERLLRSGGTRFEWIVECRSADGTVETSSVLTFDLASPPVEE